MTVIFKVRKWLEDEDFKELLRLADYLGYDAGAKRFKLNIEKALRNGYSIIDILSILREYADNYSEIKESLEVALEGYNPVFTWSQDSGVVEVVIPGSTYSLVKSSLERHNVPFKYKRAIGDRVVLHIPPYKAHEAYQLLKNIFMGVVDPGGIFSEKPLPIKPELSGIELREYQKEALNKWIENTYRGIIALPTGSGKSIVAIAALVKVAARTLIIVYTKEQILQWRDFILRFTNIPQSMIGVFYSREKKLAPVTIMTYQSGFRNINAVSPYFGFLIVDEVHHLPAEKFKYIAIHALAPYRMGLSATPTREDGKHEELFPLLGGIVYYKTPSELAKMGYLAPYTIMTVRVKLSPEERQMYEQLLRKYRELSEGKTFDEVLESARRGDNKAAEALRVHSTIRMLLAKARSKIEKAVELAKREYEKGNKVIVFTQYVEQAEEIAKKLGALLLTGETPENERKKALSLFKQADRGILVVTTVGDEGLDIPDANVGIIVSGTGSRRQFIQRLGRLLRPKPNHSGAILYEIVLDKTPEVWQARRRKSMELDEFTSDRDKEK